MASDKISIMRVILTKVPLIRSVDIEAYILDHQSIHSRIMKTDPEYNSSINPPCPYVKVAVRTLWWSAVDYELYHLVLGRLQ